MTDEEKRKLPSPPTSKQFEERKLEMLTEWAPQIYTCRHCKWPVMRGYCCNSCGSKAP
jgi:hypothetical protein